MRKIVFIVLMSFLGFVSYAQSVEEILTEIHGKWHLDDKENVVIEKVIEFPRMTKEQIYGIVLNYFNQNYTGNKSAIKIQDDNKGIIIGNGVFENMTVKDSNDIILVDTRYLVRVDVKTGKIRIMISLVEYEKRRPEGNEFVSDGTTRVSQEYPINENGERKEVLAEAFYKSFEMTNKAIESIEKAIKEESVKIIENDDW